MNCCRCWTGPINLESFIPWNCILVNFRECGTPTLCFYLTVHSPTSTLYIVPSTPTFSYPVRSAHDGFASTIASTIRYTRPRVERRIMKGRGQSLPIHRIRYLILSIAQQYYNYKELGDTRRQTCKTNNLQLELSLIYIIISLIIYTLHVTCNGCFSIC